MRILEGRVIPVVVPHVPAASPVEILAVVGALTGVYAHDAPGLQPRSLRELVDEPHPVAHSPAAEVTWLVTGVGQHDELLVDLRVLPGVLAGAS
jgi:hypothetical protein